ncbi:MAG: hypothetical protein KAQ79_10250, partial [Cyclobacteriaceae bacterium]|nr:hypothetical protein [Cyclobacteriaceae bacterium]
MIKLRLIPILISLILFSVHSTSGYELVSELRSMGYAIIPAPQKVTLNGEHVVIDNSWKIVSEIADGPIVLNRLTKGALSLHGLTFSNSGSKQIIL